MHKKRERGKVWYLTKPWGPPDLFSSSKSVFLERAFRINLGPPTNIFRPVSSTFEKLGLNFVPEKDQTILFLFIFLRTLPNIETYYAYNSNVKNIGEKKQLSIRKSLYCKMKKKRKSVMGIMRCGHKLHYLCSNLGSLALIASH